MEVNPTHTHASMGVIIFRLSTAAIQSNSRNALMQIAKSKVTSALIAELPRMGIAILDYWV